jgi:transketolase
MTQAQAGTQAGTAAELAARAHNIRRNVVRMATGKGEGYVGQGLDAAEILAALFCSELRLGAGPDDDRFILSPGHYSIALWAAMAEAGMLDAGLLDSYGADGSDIIMSTHRGAVAGVELTGGSLAHGLPVAAGMAIGNALAGRRGRIATFVSDGELQEGSQWEAIMFAGHRRLSSLLMVLDVNRTQADGPLVIEHEPLVEKLRAFGWWCEDVDGNDVSAILAGLDAARADDRPKALVCRTRLANGVPLLMQRDRAHFVRVGDDEWQTVAGQLEQGR